MKIKAFTLMEVLVALAIVGVIAVLTVPNLIGSTGSKINIVTLKSTYSQFGDALKQAMIDQGVRDIFELEFAGDTNQEKISGFLNRYLDVAQDCGAAAGSCFSETYTTYSGTSQVGNPLSYDGKDMFEYAKLSNGASIAVRIDFTDGDNEYAILIIDPNGADKPNAIGKDLFAAWINHDGSLGLGAYHPNMEGDSNVAECLSDDDAVAAVACLDVLKGKNWDLEHYLD